MTLLWASCEKLREHMWCSRCNFRHHGDDSTCCLVSSPSWRCIWRFRTCGYVLAFRIPIQGSSCSSNRLSFFNDLVGSDITPVEVSTTCFPKKSTISKRLTERRLFLPLLLNPCFTYHNHVSTKCLTKTVTWTTLISGYKRHDRPRALDSWIQSQWVHFV